MTFNKADLIKKYLSPYFSLERRDGFTYQIVESSVIGLDKPRITLCFHHRGHYILFDSF